jgi:hypothetical protein
MTALEQVRLTDSLRDEALKAGEGMREKAASGPLSDVPLEEAGLTIGACRFLRSIGVSTAGGLMAMTDAALRGAGLPEREVLKAREALRAYAEERDGTAR